MQKDAGESALNYAQAMQLVWEILFSIFVPTAVFALAGRWLDRRFHSSPWMTGLGLILALGVTALIVKRKATLYGATRR